MLVIIYLVPIIFFCSVYVGDCISCAVVLSCSAYGGDYIGRTGQNNHDKKYNHQHRQNKTRKSGQEIQSPT
jgi:hypothetical protein